MALQVWLPLDGNLENKGCLNPVIANNGATVDTAGKIGSCYNFDGNNDYISVTDSALYSIIGGGAQPFSIALWVYRADETRAILFGDYNISPITDKNFVNLELSIDHKILFYWGNGSSYNNKLSYDSVTLNAWNHIVVTYDGNVLKGYLNGTLIQTASGTLYQLGKTSGAYYLGRDNRTGTTVLNGKLNDFRIYDHCLSQAEVHELSQGLVVHYKLDGANPNLLYNSGPSTNSTSWWGMGGASYWSVLTIQENSFGPLGYIVRSECTAKGGGGIHHQPQHYKELQNGETYTFSAWARASKACQATFTNEFMTTTKTINLTPEWQFFSQTGVIDTSKSYHSDTIYVTAATSEVGMWIEACAWKLEKGSRATAWCPSPMETQYKALGYATSNSGVGRNLLRTTPKSYNSAGYRAYQLNLSTNLVAGKTYTLQFWNVNVSHSAKAASALGICVYWGGGNVNIRHLLGTSYFTDGHADYLTYTFTVTDSQASGNGATNAWLEIYNSTPSASGTMSMSIEKWKIEEGSVATPYIQSFEDNGVSAIVITDSSGYGHNATTYGSVYVSPDSPRYDTSTYFNGMSAIVAGRGGMVTDSITINAWVKYSTWGRLASCTEGGGWNFEQSPFYFQVYANGAYRNVKATAQPSANAWHMITGVYDRLNQKVKIFIDGVLNAEANSTTNAPITYHASNGIFIGAEAGNNATTPVAGYYLTGNVSDFRIYCTPLSADDIKDLYQTSAKIDNLGNVHAFELNETSMASMTKTGIAKYAQFSEFAELVDVKVDPKTYIEPDGSAWVRIFHHNNPASGVFNQTDNFASGYVYLDADRWFNFGICNKISKWEIMLKEKATFDSDEFKFRWIQPKNPMTAAYADIASTNITKITANGYTSFATGGLYLKNGETYLCTNNGNQGNWWGAVGSWNPYSGRLPAWNGVTVTTGFEDVYIRIDNLTMTDSSLAKISKNKRITANEFIER